MYAGPWTWCHEVIFRDTIVRKLGVKGSWFKSRQHEWFGVEVRMRQSWRLSELLEREPGRTVCGCGWLGIDQRYGQRSNKGGQPSASPSAADCIARTICARSAPLRT
jgi:hypothetical protein